MNKIITIKKVKILSFFLLSVMACLALGPVRTNAIAGDPIGWLDSVSGDCHLNGWAFSKDNTTTSLSVDIYLDGPKDKGKLVSTALTNIYRPDVNSYFGISGNHGFASNIPPGYQDGKTHTIYVYANNAVTTNISIVLSGVPKSCTVIMNSPTPSATPAQSVSPTPTSLPGSTITPTPSLSNIPSPTSIPSGTISPSPTPGTSATPAPSATPISSGSPSPSVTPVSGDTIRPTVSITSPSNGTTFSNRVLLTAVAQDNIGVGGVTFYHDGENPLGLEDSFAPYSMYLYASRLSLGEHTIIAGVRDKAGNTAISSPITINIVPPPDTVSPYLSAITVADITPFTVAIKWKTNEPADGQVEFCPTISHCANYTPVVTAYSIEHVINLSGLTPSTKYYYWLKSKDPSGNIIMSSTRSFTTALPPDFFSPTISITTPLNGAIVSGRIAITANAADDVSVSGVKFFVDGVLYKTEDLYAPFSVYLYTDTLSNGPHSLYVIARDGAGNLTTSAPVNIVVNNPDLVAPFISAISVTGITQFTAAISWTTNELADGQVEFCLTTSKCGNYTPLIQEFMTSHVINLSGLTPNTLYYYRIKSKDVAGNVSNSFVKSFTTSN